jgi:nucleotide-binding universal stress UspA family protein
MQLNRVLVGIDFSAPSLATARWVAECFAPRAELVLIHVIPEPRIPPYLARLRPDAQLDLAAGERSSALLGGLMALATSVGGPRATADVRVGEPAAQLSRAAKELGADVIVTGRAGQRAASGIGRQLGTTADRLVRSARVPVLVTARTPGGMPHTIFAAVDDGEISESVLAWGVYLTRKLDARLTALHVVDRDDGFARASGSERPSEESEKSGLRARVGAREHAIRDAADAWLRARVSGAGYNPSLAEIAVAVGDPRHELLAAAGCLDAGLIVIGRQGADGSERTGIGSLTRAALRPSSRPVLVIPPPEPSPILSGPFRGRRSRVLRLPDRSTARNDFSDTPASPPAARMA